MHWAKIALKTHSAQTHRRSRGEVATAAAVEVARRRSDGGQLRSGRITWWWTTKRLRSAALGDSTAETTARLLISGGKTESEQNCQLCDFVIIKITSVFRCIKPGCTGQQEIQTISAMSRFCRRWNDTRRMGSESKAVSKLLQCLFPVSRAVMSFRGPRSTARNKQPREVILRFLFLGNIAFSSQE